MSRDVVRVLCRAPFTRHRWEWVDGLMSTPKHPYIERRCKRCGEYESEIR